MLSVRFHSQACDYLGPTTAPHGPGRFSRGSLTLWLARLKAQAGGFVEANILGLDPLIGSGVGWAGWGGWGDSVGCATSTLGQATKLFS
jgi:hypothetical protein